MENKFIFADRHGFVCRVVNKSVTKIRSRTVSETDGVAVLSQKGSGYNSDNGAGSSVEFLNICIDQETKKNESFFHLFSSDSSATHHQKKTVTIMEPNGHKVYPVKSIKKEKINDGNKKITECCFSQKYFLDLSSCNLSILSRSISKLNHLTHLYIYGNKINKIPKDIGHLVNLKELWMQENDIHCLPIEMKNCKNLKHLDVRHNHLSDDCLIVVKYFINLEIMLFNNNNLTRLEGIGRLKKLETLSVKSNKLEGTITKSLGKLHNLISLDLAKNKITTIPEEIVNCTELRRLNLEYNLLIELPESVGKLQKLEIIGIKYNRLDKVPFSISDCSELKEFNIENNIISEIPSGFLIKLQQSVKINISHNKFHELPFGSTKQFSKTEKINAEYNKICHLSGGLIDAQQLRVLNLCYNSLSEITPVDVINLINLVDLNLAFNHLKELPKEINQLSRLESLDLTNNMLKTTPSEIGQLKSLKFLNLESNELISLPDDFGHLEKLKHLNISCNQLKTFPRCIVNLKCLEILNISENFITEIPEKIGNLIQLTHLFLKDNKSLNDLPISIANMKNLTFLSLNGCPLTEIPTEYSKSPTTVVAYLRALEIGLRLHQYLKVSTGNRENESLVSSDTSLNILEEKIIGNKDSIKDNNNKSAISSETNMDIRPRSMSATASSKQHHLNSTNKSRKTIQKNIPVPDYLLKKMKTTEAGFLACSTKDNKK